MKPDVYTRLSGMMFLQYFIWGVWLPLLARYLQASPDRGGLGFTPGQVGWILGLAGSIGAVVAPFVAGQVADRVMSTERFLALLIFLGGIVKYITAYQTSYVAWLGLSILYSVLYTPTLALTNSLAFAHMRDPDRGFPFVRVWGTIGWIAAGWIFPLLWLVRDVGLSALPPFYAGVDRPDAIQRIADSLRFSGMVSAAYAAFCFILPHTPPQREAAERLAFAKAFGLFRRPSFAILVAASLPVSVIHQIYFMQTSPFLGDALGLAENKIAPAMTIGQAAEIVVMGFLGMMLRELGFRWVITIGGAAYVLRYAIFGTTTLPVGLIVASQALHGFCYACFFAAAYIYVDRLADADVRHSAQTVFGIIILGVGPIVAAPTLGALSRAFTAAGGTLNYSYFWYSLMGIALATTVIFALFFRDETRGPEGSIVRPVKEIHEGID